MFVWSSMSRNETRVKVNDEHAQGKIGVVLCAIKVIARDERRSREVHQTIRLALQTRRYF